MEKKELNRLNHLSLVSNICNELETHLGQAPKDLAEYIIHLGRNSETADELDKKLKKDGAELPDYFVRSLLTVIHGIYPPRPKSDKNKDDGEEDGGDKGRFKGLAIKDTKDKVKELEKEIEREAQERQREEDRNRGRDRRDSGRDRDRRDSGRDWERDRDDRRDRHRDRNRGDEEGEDRRSGRHNRGRARGEYESRDGSSDRRRDRDEYKEEGGGGASEPELYQVYKGRVTRVMDSGCFVQFDRFRGKEGLVHVSQMATRRVDKAESLVKRDMEVYVKVVSIKDGGKYSLSMKDVDQNTGRDLIPLKKPSDNDDSGRSNPSYRTKDGQVTKTGISGIRIVEESEAAPSRRPLKKMSSPERWEAKQLIASGALKATEFPDYDEEGDGMLYQEEGAEEELEIEMNEEEPAFLQGQTRYSVDMSPVKIFKNPEGSLSRAAALQSALTKDDDSPVTVADWGVQAIVSWVLAEVFGGQNLSIVAEEDTESLSKAESLGLLGAVSSAVNEALSEASKYGLPKPDKPLGSTEILKAIGRCNSVGGPKGRHWVLDPVDGTLGFVRGDQYAVALALIENGKVLLGVLGCPNYPVKKECLSNGCNQTATTKSGAGSVSKGCVMYAKRGSGQAWMQPLTAGGYPESTSLLKVSTVDDPVLATVCEPVERANSNHLFTAGLANSMGVRKQPMRVYSMVKYAAIARGDAEVFMKFAQSSYKEKIWDHAAGVVIVEEAGGVVTDAGGRNLDFSKGVYLEGLDRGIIACSGQVLHEKIIGAVYASWESSSL